MESGSKLKRIAKEWLPSVFWAFIAWLVIRSFLLEAFNIPSASMRSTLLEGDYIVVNKMAYGPRLPNTPLSLPFFYQKCYLEWIRIPYIRIPGYSSVKRNDVVVFNYPMETEFPVDHRTHYIKRCIGLPGDLIRIDSSRVFVNDKAVQDAAGVQYLYSVITDTSGIDTSFVAEMGMEWAMFSPMRGHYYLFMTPVSADSLKQMKNIASVILNVRPKNEFVSDVFPHDTSYKWNTDFYGPLMIPRAGDSVRIDPVNISIYKRIIGVYENNSLEIKDRQVWINGKPAVYYKFKMNYYFMMGDNRHHSEDSRFWGFVPEDHIVGRASFVLFSTNSEPIGKRKARWCTWIK